MHLQSADVRDRARSKDRAKHQPLYVRSAKTAIEKTFKLTITLASSPSSLLSEWGHRSHAEQLNNLFTSLIHKPCEIMWNYSKNNIIFSAKLRPLLDIDIGLRRGSPNRPFGHPHPLRSLTSTMSSHHLVEGQLTFHFPVRGHTGSWLYRFSHDIFLHQTSSLASQLIFNH